jgi:hypothetical protein
MSIAFVLGGLVVAGVFAFVYFQKKNAENDSTSNGSNGNSGTVTPAPTADDNSSSGTGGTTPPEYST